MIETILDSLTNAWDQFITFLPNIVGAIIVFLVGWAIAVGLGKVAAKIIGMLQIDSLLERVGFKKPLERAGLKLNSGGAIGWLVKWFFVIVFLMAATDILKLTQVTDFLKRVLLYVPNVFVAILILIAAALVGEFLEKFIRASVEAAKIKSARFAGAVAKWAVWIFALLAALIQLGVAPSLINIIVTGLVAMFAIGGGLAFGLGGKDYAKELVEKFKSIF